jgi:ABC-type multidrug transport system ATPase subunit
MYLQYKGTVNLSGGLDSKNSISFYFSGDDLGDEEMTIRENIVYYIQKEKEDNYKDYKKLLQCFMLEKYENIILEKASEGMKQKMRLMICLLQKSDVVVLDEPFNYLDEATIKNILYYLNIMQIQNEVIYIIATNEVDIFSMCQNRVINLDKKED